MKIRVYPDPALRRRTLSLKEVTEEVWNKAHQMLDLMYEHKGVGLAAPQVGWNVSLIAVDTSGKREGTRLFINPTVIETAGEIEDDEGCLSFPGLGSKVRRAQRVVIAAFDLEGRKVEVEAEDLHARALQHEMDHLRGILFIDRLSDAARLALRKSLRELERVAEEK